MPLYVVDRKMDKLNLDALVLPYLNNNKLYSYYRDSKFKGFSINSFIEKIENVVKTKSLARKNQIVYLVENEEKLEDEKIPVILSSCQLPSLKDYEDGKNSDDKNKINEKLFAQEKIVLSRFYQRILKTALEYNYLRISIPIIVSDYGNSQPYIDLARKAVRHFIDNSFDEMTVYLLLTDSDNDYFSDKERAQYNFIKMLEEGACWRYWAYYANKNDVNNKFLCYNEDQYWQEYTWRQPAYDRNFSYVLERAKKRKEKRDKEKAEWEKLRGKNKLKSNKTEFENIEQLVEERLRVKDESFSEMVVRKIEENGLNSVFCYKSANVGRNIFSKITKDANKDENEDGTRYIYHPDKKIALAFAIALHLKQTEADELLQKAGFSFSNSPQDIIVKVFIEKGIYDIDLVNQQLLKHDLVLLGSSTR